MRQNKNPAQAGVKVVVIMSTKNILPLKPKESKAELAAAFKKIIVFFIENPERILCAAGACGGKCGCKK